MLNVDVVKDAWDYVAIGVGGLAALATVFAVWVAVVDSKKANQRAELADERTKQADQRADKAQAETDRLRQQQRREKEDAHAAAWADRGAIHIRASATLQGDVSGDLHAEVNFLVHNDDEHPIQNVVLITEPPHAVRAGHTDLEDRVIARWGQLKGLSSRQTVKMIYVGPADGNQGAVRLTALFDDRFGNRWRLTPDGSLLLSGRRRLGVDENPLDEEVIRCAQPMET